MSDVLILRNQHDEFLTKAKEWIAAGDSKTLYRTEFRDEIINEKVELTVKHPELRMSIIPAEAADNGRLRIDGEEFLPKEDPTDESTGEAEPQLNLVQDGIEKHDEHTPAEAIHQEVL